MPFYSQSTGMPGGFTNAAQWQTMAEAGTPDPTWAQMFSDDFDRYNAADWSLVGVGTPAAAIVTPAGGGNIGITTSAASGDRSVLQLAAATYQLTLGKQRFFKCKLTTPGANTTDLFVGLAPPGANPLAGADYFGFLCATGQNNWILRSRNASVNTDIALPASLVRALTTAVEVGFYLDAQSNCQVFFNPGTGAFQIPPVAQGGRGNVAGLMAMSPSQVPMSPTMMVQTNTAAAMTMGVDFITVSVER